MFFREQWTYSSTNHNCVICGIEYKTRGQFLGWLCVYELGRFNQCGRGYLRGQRWGHRDRTQKWVNISKEVWKYLVKENRGSCFGLNKKQNKYINRLLWPTSISHISPNLPYWAGSWNFLLFEERVSIIITMSSFYTLFLLLDVAS